MRSASLLLLVAAAAGPLTAADGIVSYASRTVIAQPDEVRADVTVTVPAGVTQQQAADFLQSNGVPGRLVSGSVGNPVIGIPQPVDVNGLFRSSTLTYRFTHSVPGSDLKDMNRKLDALSAAKSDVVRGVSASAALQLTQSSSDELFQRLLPQLIADARKRGETIAAATGLRLGKVRAVSQLPSSGGLLAVLPASASSLELAFSISVEFETE